MFEFDAGKLLIIATVALIVIGPKELPRVLRQVGQAVAKLRRMAADFQAQFMDAMREAELADIRDEAAKLVATTKNDVGLDPIGTIRNELTHAIDGAGTVPVGTASSDIPAPTPAEEPTSVLDDSERPDRRDEPGTHDPAANDGLDATPLPPAHGDERRDPAPALARAPPISRT
jgi:sec-independent protein translocase protein TatB